MLPIEEPNQLPAPGAISERATLDFKASDASDHFEAAKDVAAMANAYGGAIVVGAVAKGEMLLRYAPFEATQAGQTQRKYEEAIRDRCYPRPRVVVAQVEHEGGRVVVVNVWPFIGQAVGVALKKNDTAKGIEDVYYYPVRVGAHTVAITPEQMHMYLDARFRRTVLALRGSAGQKIWIEGRVERDGWYGTGVVSGLDEEGNGLELKLDFGDHGMIPYVLPLDDIQAVWRAGDRLKIRIHGYLEQMEWASDVDDFHRAERVMFMEVEPARREKREREQKVRVVSVPHPPSLFGEAQRFWRQWQHKRAVKQQQRRRAGQQ